MQNAPSGIAQLRKSSEQNKQTEDAQMDLDDFLVPSSIGTPAGVSPEDSALPNESSVSTTTSISAIPIKQGLDFAEQDVAESVGRSHDGFVDDAIVFDQRDASDF